MAMEIGFKKWNKCRMSGLPTDSPLALFWDCKKNSHSLCEMDHKCPYVLTLKLFVMNDLSCVEINRLMLEVLT